VRFRTCFRVHASLGLWAVGNVQHGDVRLDIVCSHPIETLWRWGAIPHSIAGMTKPFLNVVLHQPEIPQNTGNIGRTCVATGARLWLIQPLGFRLDDRYLKRAGMDYWQHLDWNVVASWQELKQYLPGAAVWYLTKSATRCVWDAAFQAGDIILFGSESRGLPPSILAENPASRLKLPMRPQVRSLNLASTVNTVVYEAVRQLGGL